MIELRIGEKREYSLDMLPGSGINFDLHPPLFLKGQIKGSYSFPFTFPRTDNNDIALMHAAVLEVNPKTITYSCDVIFKGVKLYPGILRVTASNKLQYEGNVTVGVSAMAVIKKKLYDIYLGGEREIVTAETLMISSAAMIAHANAQIALTYPAADYTFPPHKNEKFYYEGTTNKNADFEGIINRWNNSTQTFTPNSINTNPTPDNTETLVPWVYLLYVLKMGFLEEGFTIDGDATVDEEIKQVILYNNYSLDKKYGTYSVQATAKLSQTISVETTVVFEKDTGGTDHDEAGIYNTSTGQYTIVEEGYHNLFARIKNYSSSGSGSIIGSPLVRIIFYKNASAIATSITAFPAGWWDHTYQVYFTAADIGKKITVTVEAYGSGGGNFTIDVQGSYLQIQNTSLNDLNLYAQSINLQNHMPDKTFGDLLDWFIKKFNIDVSYDMGSRKVSLNFIEQKCGSSAKADDLTDRASNSYETNYEPAGFTLKSNFSSDDLFSENNFKAIDADKVIGEVDIAANLPTPQNAGDLIFVKNKNRWYRTELDANIVPQWVFYSDNYYDEVIGDGDEELASDGPVFVDEIQLITSSGIAPVASQKGSSEAFSLGINRVKDIRVAFYRGMQPCNNSTLYPMATTTRYDSLGNTIGEYELRHDGDNGIYKKFWYTWLQALARGEIVLWNMNLELPDLLAFNNNVKKRIGYLVFIYRKASVTIEKTIKTTLVEFIKL